MCVFALLVLVLHDHKHAGLEVYIVLTQPRLMKEVRQSSSIAYQNKLQQ